MAPWSTIHKKYHYAFQRLQGKYRRKEKIRVGFSVIFESIFPLQHVFELMRESEMFEPFLIAVPDISRGTEQLLTAYIRTCASLQAQYPGAELLRTYTPRDASFIQDIVSTCDMYCPSIPYDGMVPPPYRHGQFWAKGVPVFYTPYGPCVSRASEEFIRNTPFFANFWRFYAQAKREMDALPLANIRLSGFAKLDKMAEISKKPSPRKKIIIAPHHTIFKNHNSITYGHFFHYAELIARLPALFPHADFVFRPHPLLVQNLHRHSAWGRKKTTAWLDALRRHSNVEIQEGGEYLTTFVESDALIHDCGSFIAEYLFTGNPCCYMWDTESDVFAQFSELGKECLEAHYIAKKEAGILNFIDTVLMEGRDDLLEKRRNIEQRLKHNYPHCSQYIVDDIKNAIIDAQRTFPIMINERESECSREY
ncbi:MULTISPECIES: hypothetical protein [unclassified Desulfovibrio]|uniref:hypothetical protein n=1 Tax=unclassified Desulfovibrio TaxID=2593640 RepID=UPI0013EB4621|nr:MULTISPECIES: hypothetical protein [unclassified Desulfovibrio]